MTDTALRVELCVWPSEAPSLRLAASDVLVCSASVRAEGDTVAHAVEVLDPSERERFQRYENADVARRFAVGRLRLREMLGALLGLSPAAVPIQLGLHGKPALGRAAQSTGIRFSVAHCDELLLVALSLQGDVGVDVERVRAIERWARVADRVFGPSDRAALGRQIASGDEPSSAFFRFWCRGEAELKAVGSGISGLGAHREGWHPAGLRVAELSHVPLPDDLAAEGVRYEAAVALCEPREVTAPRSASETLQARPPRNTPTSASTA